MNVEVEQLRHTYPSERCAALRVAELRVASRARLCLLGRSGSGKSTLLAVLAGVLVPSTGRVRLDGVDWLALGEAERDRWRCRRIGCVFQTFNLLQGLTALENLTLAQRFAGVATAAARRRAFELLELLGLSERAHARPRELSIGEQQRVAIARAVSKRPDLLLADEPTASLDDDNAQAAIDILLRCSTESTLIVATHDQRLMRRFEQVVELSALAGEG